MIIQDAEIASLNNNSDALILYDTAVKWVLLRCPLPSINQMFFQNCYKSWLDRRRRLGALFGPYCQALCSWIVHKVRISLARLPSDKRRSGRTWGRTSAQSDISTIRLGCQRHRVRTYQFYSQSYLWWARTTLGNLCFAKLPKDPHIRHRELHLH